MSISEEFPRMWADASIGAVGYILPINWIDYDVESSVGEIGYEVPDAQDPIEVAGVPVRSFVIRYKYTKRKNNEYFITG